MAVEVLVLSQYDPSTNGGWAVHKMAMDVP
ncbi:hypothetical protein MRB53_015844, partial [Persea americana]